MFSPCLQTKIIAEGSRFAEGAVRITAIGARLGRDPRQLAGKSRGACSAILSRPFRRFCRGCQKDNFALAPTPAHEPHSAQGLADPNPGLIEFVPTCAH
jgi:hypothetical protein